MLIELLINGFERPPVADVSQKTKKNEISKSIRMILPMFLTTILRVLLGKRTQSELHSPLHFNY